MSDPAWGPQAARCRASRCCVCMAYGERERGPVEPHHEPPIGRDHGTRPRAELDLDTIPLCHPHHMERHDLGERRFWSRYGRVDWHAVREHMRRGLAPWCEIVWIPF